MKKSTLAFIDLETTGTNPEKHEIIEIGCVLARQITQKGRGPLLEKIEEFDIKVKPEHIETAEKEALRVNRYDEADWLFASRKEDAIRFLVSKVEDAVMVGQNVSFDAAFLDRAFREFGIREPMHYHKLDIVSLAYAKLYNDETINNFSLRSLCEYFRVTNERAHTALSDARAAFEVYKKVMGV